MPKILKIRELGDPILRKKAKNVSAAEIKSKKFKAFMKSLVATCKANDGVGIAAPQTGESKRVFIVWSQPNKRYPKAPKMEPLVVINPKIVSVSKKHAFGWEGCLSIPGLRAIVLRPTSIVVDFQDETGRKISKKFSGFPARIFLHEFDHIEGIVYLDRADPRDIVTEKEFKKIIKKK